MPGKATSLTEKVLSTSTSGRVELWTEALHRCVTRAMLSGNGIGSADTMARELGHGFHNAFLAIWYNAGFVGFLAVLLFIVIYITRSYSQTRRFRTNEMGEYSRIALGYMLGMTAIGLFENSFASSSGIAVFMLMVIAALIDRIGQIGDQYSYDTLDYEDGAFEQEDGLMTDDWYQSEESDSEDTHVLY